MLAIDYMHCIWTSDNYRGNAAEISNDHMIDKNHLSLI